MAEAISIKITNIKEIKAAFGEAPSLMTTELNTAIKKSIFTVQGESVRKTPVDTGRLRASHRSLFGNLRGEVGTNTNYDVYVHNGTRFMKGRPYLADAVQQSQQTIQKFFTQAVQVVLAKIARNT